MNKIILVSSLLICVATSVQSVDINGYYEGQLSGQTLNSEFFLVDYNKLRVDLSAKESDKVLLNGDIIYRVFDGRT